jgi:hypothetical protein
LVESFIERGETLLFTMLWAEFSLQGRHLLRRGIVVARRSRAKLHDPWRVVIFERRSLEMPVGIKKSVGVIL